jgi:hypothetical protein
MVQFQLKAFAADDYKDRTEYAIGGIEGGAPIQVQNATRAVDVIRSQILQAQARIAEGTNGAEVDANDAEVEIEAESPE